MMYLCIILLWFPIYVSFSFKQLDSSAVFVTFSSLFPYIIFYKINEALDPDTFINIIILSCCGIVFFYICGYTHAQNLKFTYIHVCPLTAFVFQSLFCVGVLLGQWLLPVWLPQVSAGRTRWKLITQAPLLLPMWPPPSLAHQCLCRRLHAEMASAWLFFCTTHVNV